VTVCDKHETDSYYLGKWVEKTGEKMGFFFLYRLQPFRFALEKG
jgi:hypothetical protein